MVIIVPVLFFVVMGIVQFGLWMHASHIADAAARAGVAAGRLDGAPPDAGSDAAQHTLDRLADGLIEHRSVDARRTADRVTVRVTGTVRAVVPGLGFTVNGMADGPVERFQADA